MLLAFAPWPAAAATATSASAAAAAATAPTAPQRLASAEFSPDAQGPWQRVDLPDTWSQRGVPRPGRGWYRFTLDLPAGAADGPLALHAERVGNHHRLWVNGQLLQDTLADAAHSRPQALPLLLRLPPGLLRPGGNRVELEVAGGLRAGLSVLSLGPAATIEREHLALRRANEGLPQALNAAAAGACLFALLLWQRRRSEAALGWFGALGLLASLRNVAYYEGDLGLAPVLSSTLFFVVQVTTALLLGLFAIAVARRPARLYRALLLAGAALLLASGVLAAVAGAAQLDQVRAWAYPVLAALVLPAVGLLGQRARSLRPATLGALAATLALVLVAAGHDYLHQQGRLAVTAQWWLPWATPMAVLAFAVLMLNRVVAAMRQVEVLNQTLETRVQERTLALAEANEAKSRFLAAASHDLRQPVATLAMLVRVLRDGATPPLAATALTQLDRAVAALGAQLAGLLDLSRLSSGGTRVQPRRVPLQPLFDRLGLAEAEPARRKGLVLRVRPTPLAVHADPVLLEQVLRNLVGNAVRHTARGGVLLCARRAAAGSVRVQVFDTGPGLTARDQAVLFAADAAGGPLGLGHGLGLSIVRRAAALMQTPLRLRSVAGRGSVFTLGLPCDDQPDAPALLALGGLQLLLVESRTAEREALARRLRESGAEVFACPSPRLLRRHLDALPARRRQADLLLTALRLQEGSGFDVARLARRRLGEVPVLVLADEDDTHDDAALAAAGCRVLHAPDAATLAAAIAAAAGLSLSR
ncbi:MAG: ATP-binding protein [Rubrivivax sp.]|nr:ATP-binding protein [Rubrivivax sp.]